MMVVDRASLASIPVDFHSRDQRLTSGKNIREKIPRESHAAWEPPQEGRDPVEILLASNHDRLPELIPIRHGRMLRSAFTFLRGSASLMAHDMQFTPQSGFRVQACGDCHLLNFGLFATPERNLVFDINDFDETLAAPWEWDVKRLAVSSVVAARDNGSTDDDARKAALACVCSYREHLREYTKMNPLEVWYDRIDIDTLIKMAPNERARKQRMDLAETARVRIGEYLFPKITEVVGGRHRLAEQPPLLVHNIDISQVEQTIVAYRDSLSDDRRVLFDRYRQEDVAMKVVGIGSVGTRCAVGLFFSAENHPLLLQFKEARNSVLEPYAGKSIFENQGQRVVMGQRLMQSSSDIFLGWTRGRNGRDFFVRQLRDMKFSVPMEGFTNAQLIRYVEICGWSLARAHAKSGDASAISGYLGKSDVFDEAIADFSLSYADQNERDYQAMVEAHKSGKIEAIFEEDL